MAVFRSRRGYSLTEVVLALVCLLAVAAVSFSVFRLALDEVSSDTERWKLRQLVVGPIGYERSRGFFPSLAEATESEPEANFRADQVSEIGEVAYRVESVSGVPYLLLALKDSEELCAGIAVPAQRAGLPTETMLFPASTCSYVAMLSKMADPEPLEEW